MGPAEVLHRLAEKGRAIASRRRDEGWQHYPARALHTVFAGLRDASKLAPPELRRAITAAAEETLAGRFSALGRDWPRRDPANLFPPGLWSLDPVTGRAWPGTGTYAFDVDFRHDGSLGDVKYVWEINRLQMLPPLAAHVLLENDDRGLHAIEAAIDSWHGANPPFRGVGWASGIEVALRAISLIVTHDLLGNRLGADTRRRIGEILAASAYWLPRFPSLHSSANNHRIAELTGEYLIGLARGRGDGKAAGELAKEARKQILADGAGAEQSPTYGAFTAELVLLCALAARCSKTPLPREVEARLAAFADFVDWIGPRTRFGDDDEGRVLASGSEPDYPASIAAAIRGFLDQPGIAAPGDDFRALLFGRPTTQAAPPAGLKTFPEGGLSIWRGEIAGRRIELTFDHGPLGYLSIAAHGHADALALTLSIDDRPVLVDPGTFLYGSGGIWRDWFRSTPAHNTLNIDGQSQSVMSGSFNWSHKAAATLVASSPSPDWSLRARQDGYRRRFGVIHEREISLCGRVIEVTDRLLGGKRAAEIVFQLAEGLSAYGEGESVSIRNGERQLLTIELPAGEFSIARGGDKPGEGGWVSPRFGVRLAADRIAWHGEVGESGVVTRLVPASR